MTDKVTDRPRINFEEIKDQAMHDGKNPAIRPYTDSERAAITDAETADSNSAYKNFCGFLVRSWIDQTRYLNAINAGRISEVHFTGLSTATTNALGAYTKYHETSGMFDINAAIDKAAQLCEAVDPTQTFVYHQLRNA